MPEEGMQWMERGLLLTYEEITRLVSIAARLGVSRVRLTGGEPLMRNDLRVLVQMIREIRDIKEIALTTNGYFLKEHAGALKQAGLDRINISLDSLDPVTFTGMVRRSHFEQVWEGIEEAERVGLAPIKLNVVLLRGVNDGEILEFAELARHRACIVRFIEFMPIGKDDGWSVEKVVTTEEVLETIQARHQLVPVAHSDRKAPADRFIFAEGKGEIGFISSVSRPFCSDCDRVRVTSDGKFRTCLFSLKETDLRAMLRDGATDDQIAGALVAAVRMKEEGHLINRPGFVRPARTMSQIGG